MATESKYDLSIQVQIPVENELPALRMQHAAEWVLSVHDVEAGTGISIVITGDEEVRRLNRQFRNVDKPTDVLSFPADPTPEFEGEDPYLGDLVLALPYIRRQAESEGHRLSDELTLAVIHGTLHLLGYDHDTAEHQAAMWSVQADALRNMEVAITVPLFEFLDELDTDEPMSPDNPA